MKIGFLSHVFPPNSYGVSTYSKCLVEALADKGHEIHLISGVPKGYGHSNVFTYNVNPLNSRNIYMRYANYFLTSNVFLAKVKRELSVVHNNLLFDFSTPFSDVVTVHQLACAFLEECNKKVPIPFGFSKFVAKLEKIMAKKAKKLVSLTPSMTSTLVNRYSVKRENVVTIPNGLNLGDFKKRFKREEFIFYAGRLDIDKGFPMLLEAVESLDIDGFRLVVAGERVLTPRKAFSKRLERLKRQGKVEALGYIPSQKVFEHMSRAKAVIVPSIYESFGLTALEAMASGAPLVISNGCGIVEYMDEGDAVFIEPNVKEISEAIKRVWKDDSLRKSISKKGRSRAREFSWDSISRRMLGVYESVSAR